MAVQESVRCEKEYKTNLFEWYFNKNENKPYSSSFRCCGCSCFFIYKMRSSFDICLNVFSEPFKQNISISYIVKLINCNGMVDLTKRGTIESSNETCLEVLFQHITNKSIFSICFTWFEDDTTDTNNQGVKVKQGTSASGIECTTQTENIQFPLSSNVRNTAKVSTEIEKAAQTESTQPSNDVCSCKDNENNKFLEILSKDLSSYFDCKTDPDCVLKVEEAKFSVHRSVLSARSSVFAAMFHHDTSESRNGEVDILDVDACAFGNVLYYIYAGKVRGLSPDTAAAMYVVSDKYALIDFREKCLDFLKKNLTMENVCDAALLAHAHAETELETEVLQFIEERLEELVQNDNWRIFSDTHYKLANGLLSSAFIAAKNKKKLSTH